MKTFDPDEFSEVGRKYEAAFPGFYVMSPFGIGKETILEALKKALKENKPISYDFDW